MITQSGLYGIQQLTANHFQIIGICYYENLLAVYLHKYLFK